MKRAIVRDSSLMTALGQIRHNGDYIPVKDRRLTQVFNRLLAGLQRWGSLLVGIPPVFYSCERRCV